MSTNETAKTPETTTPARAAWREFTKEDWYGYASCRPFDRDAKGDCLGGKPMIASIKVTDAEGTYDAIAILDGHGIGIEVYDVPAEVTGYEDPGAGSLYCIHPKLHREEVFVLRATALLPAVVSRDELTALGFTLTV